MADYRTERDETIVVFLTEKSTRRAAGPNPKVGARLAFKTSYDAAEFVRAGESEGLTFGGKEFPAEAASSDPNSLSPRPSPTG
jgi:hypothetical protein